jgi:hypothetical protein
MNQARTTCHDGDGAYLKYRQSSAPPNSSEVGSIGQLGSSGQGESPVPNGDYEPIAGQRIRKFPFLSSNPLSGANFVSKRTISGADGVKYCWKRLSNGGTSLDSILRLHSQGTSRRESCGNLRYGRPDSYSLSCERRVSATAACFLSEAKAIASLAVFTASSNRPTSA